MWKKINIWIKTSVDSCRRYHEPKLQENCSEIWHSKVMTQYNRTKTLSQIAE